MAKKNHPARAPEPAPQPVPPPQPPRTEDTVSKTQLWTFWLGVAAAVVIARALDAALPGVSESVIERWVMLGFAAFIGVFLYKL